MNRRDMLKTAAASIAAGTIPAAASDPGADARRLWYLKTRLGEGRPGGPPTVSYQGETFAVRSIEKRPVHGRDGRVIGMKTIVTTERVDPV